MTSEPASREPDGGGDQFLLGELSSGFKSLGEKCDIILKTFEKHAESDERQFGALHSAIADVRGEQSGMKVVTAKWSGIAVAVIVVLGWLTPLIIDRVFGR